MEIAVIGMAIEATATRSLNQFRHALSSGWDLVGPFPRSRYKDAAPFLEDARKLRGGHGARLQFGHGAFLERIDQFDASFFRTSPAEAIVMDPAQRLFLQCAAACFADSGYPGDALRGTSTGVFVGYMPDFRPFNYRNLVMKNNAYGIDQITAPNLVSVIPSRVSYCLDLVGPAICFDTSCSSALVAVHHACRSLAAGECDQALVGSVKLNLAPFLDLPKPAIESLNYRSRVFDARASGIGIGEGVGSVLLKPLEAAVRDRDAIYCVVAGTALNQDGRSNGIARPNGDAQVRVIRSAWRDAGIEGRDVGYIEAHGTGTEVGDPIELGAIAKALATSTARRQFCAVGSVKANYGHWYEAAGILSFIKAALAIHHGELYPQINLSRLTDAVPLENTGIYIPLVPARWLEPDRRRYAGINGFGVSGTNAHVVLAEHCVPAAQVPEPAEPHVFVASAPTPDALERRLRAFSTALDQGARLMDVCFTAADTDGGHEHRVAFAVRSATSLQQELQSWMARKQHDGTGATWGSIASHPRERVGADREEFAGARRVRLPSEATSVDRYWVDTAAPPACSPTLWHYGTSWQLTEPSGFAAPNTARVLIVHSGHPIAHDLSTDLSSRGVGVTLTLGDRFRTEDLEHITDIIHLGSIGLECAASLDALERLQAVGHLSLLPLLQALAPKKTQTTIHLVTQTAFLVTGKESRIRPLGAALAGFGRAIRREYRTVICRALDVDEGVSARRIISHLWDRSDSYQRCVRGDGLYNQVFDALPRAGREGKGLTVRGNGFYFITGGTGGLGLEFARLLVMRGARNIVLASRSGTVSDRHRAKFNLLIELGAWVQVLRVDAGDVRSLQSLVINSIKAYGLLRGVVHAAGIPGSHIAGQQTMTEYRRVTDVKVHASWALVELAREYNPDFVILYSSVAVLFPAVGQGDYCAGNAYMDALAESSRAEGLAVWAVDWVAWRDTGMAFDLGSNVNTTFKAVSTRDAHNALLDFLRSNRAVALIGELNRVESTYSVLSSYGLVVGRGIVEELGVLPGGGGQTVATSPTSDAVPTGRPSGEYSDEEVALARIWGRVLGHRSVDVNADIYDLGGDSLAIAVLVEVVEAEIGAALNIADVVSHGSIAALAQSSLNGGT